MTVETIITALHAYKVRPVARDRWRASCPVCGERNGNTLSIGATPEGAVLLRCFKSECSIESITGALGLEVADLFPPRDSFAGPLQRRRMISDRQAFDLLRDEVQLVAVVAANIGHGVALTDDDRARTLKAAARIAFLRDEVVA